LNTSTPLRAMSNATLEKLAWILIYSGLLIVCLGLFVHRTNVPFGWTLMIAGALDAGAGAVLIWLRSRR
jgi:hypothetical protein